MVTPDKFREECGVVAIHSNAEAEKLAYLGLHALQHRGQESAGIATSDGMSLHFHKAMGLVPDIFTPAAKAALAALAADRLRWGPRAAWAVSLTPVALFALAWLVTAEGPSAGAVGFWLAYQPNWVYSPARYYWTPSGYLFCDGYWDYPLQNRGLLFAPIARDLEEVFLALT